MKQPINSFSICQKYQPILSLFEPSRLNFQQPNIFKGYPFRIIYKIIDIEMDNIDNAVDNIPPPDQA